MLRQHRDLLRDNDYYLLTHIDIVTEPDFLQVLCEAKILLPGHIDSLKKFISNKQKVKRFLEILPKRGSTAFASFMDALLKSNQPYIHDKLCMCLNNELLASYSVQESFDSIDSCVDNRYESDSRRIILIINNVSFEEKNLNRGGSENDTLKLVDFFVQTLKYNMFNDKFYEDQVACDIIEIIQEFTSYITSNPTSLAVVVLMSHGKNNSISGSNDELIEIQQILKILSKATDHIFKLVIFSCCRGDTASMAYETGQVISVHEMARRPQYTSYLKQCGHFTPKNSIVLYSTQDLYQSYRESCGTIFIQSMLSLFRDNYKNKSIRDMVIKIKDEMKALYPQYDQFPDIKENYFANFYL